jgi:choline-sulfatase
LVFAAVGRLSTKTTTVMTRPLNLVFILSDNHAAAMLGCAGHATVRTPNLDALARRGTRFCAAYTTSPLCVPARASLATGRYVHDIGTWDNAHAYDGQAPSWGHDLIAAGHHVAAVGKLHYQRADPAANGFSEEIEAMHLYGEEGDLAGLIRDELVVRAGSLKLGPRAGAGESEYTQYDRRIADLSCNWLREAARLRRDKPWMLYVGFVAPHPPLIAPPEFYGLYPLDGIALPKQYEASTRPRHPYVDALRICRPFDDGFTGPEMVRRAIAGYWALISYLDRHVGQVLKTLEDTGLLRNTRVIYSSDHGEMLGAHGLWGKSVWYEEAARVPLIVAGPDWPGRPLVATPVTHVDAFPTIVEAVTGAAPAPSRNLRGTSLFEVACAADDTQRPAFGEFHAGGSITGAYFLRKGRYKYVYYAGLRPMLFDLENDPDELDDLAGTAAGHAALAQLDAELRQILDPDDVDRRAKAAQRLKIEAAGGKQRILARGAWQNSPPPGETPGFIPLQTAGSAAPFFAARD